MIAISAVMASSSRGQQSALGATLPTTNSPSVTVAGYKAAASAFAPGKILYTNPLLPQSALLNSLPLRNELVAELQAYLESFVQLINPSDRQADQMKSNTSALWNNLRINSQRAAGMFLYNREGLTPLASPYDTTDAQLMRRGLSDQHLDQMQSDVLRLVNASRRSSVSDSLRYMRRSLNELCNVASLLVPLNESEAAATFAAATAGLRDDNEDDDDDVDRNDNRNGKSTSSTGTLLSQQRPPMPFLNIPRLLGRATVVLSFQRPGPERIVPSSLASEDGTALVTLVVDGTNYPLTGGSFLDLCLRGYYNQIPVRCDPFEFEGDRVMRTVFGSEKAPFNEPLAVKPRRLPLEVLRDSRTTLAVPAATTTSTSSNSGNGNSSSATVSAFNGGSNGGPSFVSSSDSSTSAVSRFTATGLARNSAVFTKAQPVLSFATYGSIGMVHSIGDGLGDGASSSFFWVPPDRSLSVSERETSSAVKRLNSRCSLFAHVIEGNDILEMLKPGDVLVTAEVKEEEGSGVWKLLRPADADFRDVLMPAEEEDD